MWKMLIGLIGAIVGIWVLGYFAGWLVTGIVISGLTSFGTWSTIKEYEEEQKSDNQPQVQEGSIEGSGFRVMWVYAIKILCILSFLGSIVLICILIMRFI